MMGGFNALALVLAVRLIVLIAIFGAIGLGWLAMERPDPYRIAVLGAYLLGTVVPLIWLAARGRGAGS